MPGLSFDFIQSLREKHCREELGLFFVEGLRFVNRALDAGLKPKGVFFCRQRIQSGALEQVLDRLPNVQQLELNRTEAEHLALGPEPYGIGLVLPLLWEPLSDLRVTRNNLWVGVESIRSSGNAGTILRTCEAVGSDTMIIFDRSEAGSDAGLDPHDPGLVRATMGGLFATRFVRCTHSQFRTWSRRWDLSVIGLSPDAEVDYRRVSFRRSVLLMLGNERKGLTPGQRRTCDSLVKLPMQPGLDSLNLAVAAGVVLYEAYSQRHPLRTRR